MIVESGEERHFLIPEAAGRRISSALQNKPYAGLGEIDDSIAILGQESTIVSDEQQAGFFSNLTSAQKRSRSILEAFPKGQVEVIAGPTYEDLAVLPDEEFAQNGSTPIAQTADDIITLAHAIQHRFNTNNTVIFGNASLLAQSNDAVSVHHANEQIRLAVNRIRDVVDEVVYELIQESTLAANGNSTHPTNEEVV
jgi:hypothetical protein